MFQRLIAVLGLTLCVIGCGREELPFTDNSQDSGLYVQNLRSMIETNCNAARKGDPSIHLAPLIQELDRDDRPVGGHRETCEELRSLCREAVDKIRGTTSGRPDVAAQLDAMLKLAEKLPGKTTPARKPPS